MSEESKVNDQPETDHVQSEEIDNNEAEQERVKNPEAVLKKNRELLGKYKSLEEKLEQERQQREKLEQEKLEEQGKYQELYERQKKERERLEQQTKEERAKYAYSTIVSQVKQKALQEGCQNPDKLIKLTQEELEEIDFDDNYNVDNDSLQSFMDRARKDNDFLFRSKNNKPRDFTPGSSGAEDFSQKPKEVKDLSKGELSGLYAKLREQEMSSGR